MHFGNIQDLVKTQVEWITKGFHFLYKKKIVLVQSRWTAWAPCETLITLIVLKHITNYSKLNLWEAEEQGKNHVCSHCTLLSYWNRLFHCFCLTCLWVGWWSTGPWCIFKLNPSTDGWWQISAGTHMVTKHSRIHLGLLSCLLQLCAEKVLKFSICFVVLLWGCIWGMKTFHRRSLCAT